MDGGTEELSAPSEDRVDKLERNCVSRREFLKLAGIAGAAIGMGAGLAGAVAGCGEAEETTTTTGAGASTTATTAGSTTTTSAGAEMGREIKVGFSSPGTGIYASFGVPDGWCVDKWNAIFKDGLLCGDGLVHPITIIVKDNQSDSNRASQVTGDLINNDKVDIVICDSTPDLVNPASDQCEAAGMPCVSNDAPWQAYFFGRNGDPEVGFKWTYHMFWGLDEIHANFLDMWAKIPTNQVVGGMWPNDADGNAWRPAWLQKFEELGGWTVIDPGAFQLGTEDFTQMISLFKKEGVEIITGVMPPPDFTNFWKQAIQQGLQPVFLTMAKALLFPQSVEALGEIAANTTTECWWSPYHPFKSSLTGETTAELAADFESTAGTQWTQPILHYALMEVVADALKRTADVDDKEQIIEAVRTTKMDTMAGPIDFTEPVDPMGNHPVPNVYKTPQVGSQWVKGTGEWPFELAIVANPVAPMVPVQAEVLPMPKI